MTTYEQRQAARTAIMASLITDGRRHDQELRRLKVQEARAITDSLGPTEDTGDGFLFAARAARLEDARRAHQARQQRATKARDADSRLHASLARQFGTDHADAWMTGGDAA
jgi:hypothetical protein